MIECKRLDSGSAVSQRLATTLQRLQLRSQVTTHATSPSDRPPQSLLILKVKWLKSAYSSSHETHLRVRSVTCHTGSHCVTCHPTQVNAPRLNPSLADRYLVHLSRRDGRLSWPGRLLGYIPRWFTCPKTATLYNLLRNLMSWNKLCGYFECREQGINLDSCTDHWWWTILDAVVTCKRK